MSKDVENIEYGPCNVTYNAIDLGWFQGGVTAVYTVEWLDIEVDLYSAPVDSRVMKESIIVTVPLAETDLTTLQQLMPMGTYVLDGGGVKKKIGIGGAQVAKTDFKELKVIPTEDNSGTEVSANENEMITVFVARPNIQFNKAYNRDGNRVVPVEFMGLVDTTKTAGLNLCLFGDSTATA